LNQIDCGHRPLDSNSPFSALNSFLDR
jgi:hypothetical protein